MIGERLVKVYLSTGHRWLERNRRRLLAIKLIPYLHPHAHRRELHFVCALEPEVGHYTETGIGAERVIQDQSRRIANKETRRGPARGGWRAKRADLRSGWRHGQQQQRCSA